MSAIERLRSLTSTGAIGAYDADTLITDVAMVLAEVEGIKMTSTDERAIRSTNIHRRIEVIFRDAEQQAHDAVQARDDVWSQNTELQALVEQKKREIAALKQQGDQLESDLALAIQVMREYRRLAGDLNTVQIGAERLLDGLRELEERYEAHDLA